ncbi:hypothetical protein AvCA_10100 [Azotobacter vinelandii CA]|uniref:SPOR domain-containing protein n=2 Tax=Azotobacter vinelandii TaxID=354 RepID=C1DNM6_AZOVD|nr:hypothetical protein [Azotobacter vinelandii]ACO77242.1 conserved hypothetical protein [Azotobacter vinelandii DJ]AGK17125.1 hypothetical protein AvCA_10100 [Azotobacter vinelandii CA]AGK19662.1 hypothetical protein AvCA6_10100 [Azotobacter vinelandii CA6]WKN22927.1 hypothetical protein AVAEIV_000937 [Azotobacter vinelandii]SFX63617.1 hypothetical protein SAMN04244547_02221 [Azotobacter vinelandii]
MHVTIRPIVSPRDRWTVQLDRFAVPFRSEHEARQFASRLENRLKAPHSWPRNER